MGKGEMTEEHDAAKMGVIMSKISGSGFTEGDVMTYYSSLLTHNTEDLKGMKPEQITRVIEDKKRVASYIFP